MNLRAWWIPTLILGALLWLCTILYVRGLFIDREVPIVVDLGDKRCVLRRYEVAVFETPGGDMVYVVRLPKEVKRMGVE